MTDDCHLAERPNARLKTLHPREWRPTDSKHSLCSSFEEASTCEMPDTTMDDLRKLIETHQPVLLLRQFHDASDQFVCCHAPNEGSDIGEPEMSGRVA